MKIALLSVWTILDMNQSTLILGLAGVLKLCHSVILCIIDYNPKCIQLLIFSHVRSPASLQCEHVLRHFQEDRGLFPFWPMRWSPKSNKGRSPDMNWATHDFTSSLWAAIGTVQLMEQHSHCNSWCCTVGWSLLTMNSNIRRQQPRASHSADVCFTYTLHLLIHRYLIDVFIQTLSCAPTHASAHTDTEVSWWNNTCMNTLKWSTLHRVRSPKLSCCSTYQ